MWLTWLGIGLGAWVVVAVVLGTLVGRATRYEPPAILDVALPDIDGLAFCRALRDRTRSDQALVEPASVILLTGGDVSLGTARTAGADALLRKPFSPLE